MSTMDVRRTTTGSTGTTRKVLYAIAAIALLTGAAIALSRLRTAAPSVDRSSLWIDEVKRGSMRRDVHGAGTLLPEETRWIAAQTDARVDRIVLRPGAPVTPDSVIVELSNPALQRDVLDAEYQLAAARADYRSLEVQLQSDILNEQATAAAVRSDYEQARIQNDVDERLLAQGLSSNVTASLSKVRVEQLAIRLRVEEARTRNASDSATARLLAQQSHVDQQRALYELRLRELDGLHIRAGIRGVVQLVPVEVGQRVAPGTNVARVADPSRLEAAIRIAETEAKDVEIGQQCSVDTRNGIIAGKVSRIDPAVKDGTVTVDVTLNDALPPGARPDLSVDGAIEIENLIDVLSVGRPAHSQPDSNLGIFKLVDGGNEAVRVNVRLGRGSVSNIEVLQGLHAGDKVILSDLSEWDRFNRIRLK